MSEEKNSQEQEIVAPENESGQAKQDNGKTVAILSYFLVGIVWFFADETIKKDEFAKFHVKQAIVLLVASIGGSIILGISMIGLIILPLWNIASLVFFVIGIINAAQGEKKELPFIGTYAKFLKF